MPETDTDHDATTALARLLTEWSVAEPHTRAAEAVALLRGRGWRPTPARREEGWREAGAAATPEQARAYATWIREKLARPPDGHSDAPEPPTHPDTPGTAR